MTDRRITILGVGVVALVALIGAVVRGVPGEELIDLTGLAVAALLPSPLSRSAVPEVPPET